MPRPSKLIPVFTVAISGDLDIGQKSAFGPRLRPFLAEPDDQALLAKGSFVSEALYAWCQEGEEAYWPRPCPA